MKYVIFIVVLLCMLQACKKKLVEEKTDFGYDYLPLNIGESLKYKVDSTFFNDFTGADSTYSFTERHTYAEIYTDAGGRENMRVEVSRKYSDTSDYQIVSSYAIYTNEFSAEKLIDNLRIVSLSFPVNQGAKWDGHAFNRLEEDDFRYDYVDKSTTVGAIDFESTTRVIQLEDTNNLVLRRFDEERYARNIGLIYSEHLFVRSKINGDSGVLVIRRLIGD